MGREPGGRFGDRLACRRDGKAQFRSRQSRVVAEVGARQASQKWVALPSAGPEPGERCSVTRGWRPGGNTQGESRFAEQRVVRDVLAADDERLAGLPTAQRFDRGGRSVGCAHYVHALSLIHISEPTRLGMISYAVFCLKKKTIK